MATCPNKYHPDWKDLVDSVGENKAHYLWSLNLGDVPNVEYATKTFNNKLNEKLKEFIKGLNITIKENDDELLKSLELKTGTPLAGFDILQKYLSLSSKITQKELKLQSANIIYSFLGKKSILGVQIWKNIESWSKYKEIYQKFDNVYDTVADEFEYEETGFNPFAHKQAIIHFIADMLEFGLDNDYVGEKRINPDLSREWFKAQGNFDPYVKNPLMRAINKLLNWINQEILGKRIFHKLKEEELKDLVLDIVDDVYKKDYSKYIRVYSEKNGKIVDNKGQVYEQKFYEETLNRDPFAKKIIHTLFNNPFIDFKLSGSQVTRKYGTLLRAINEDLHDIDGIIPLSTFRREATAPSFYAWLTTRGLELNAQKNNKQFFKEVVPRLEKQNWYRNVKHHFPNFVLDNIFIGRDHKAAESLTITGHIPNPNEIDEKTGKPKEYIIDLFLRVSEGNYPEIYDNYWKDWKQIFEAKINMGRAKDINDLIFFQPFKDDKFKFTNKGFRYFSFAEDTFKRKNSSNEFEGDPLKGCK